MKNNFHLCWFSCSPVEERLSPIQHSRFCWYGLSKTHLTFIFVVFSHGFPTGIKEQLVTRSWIIRLPPCLSRAAALHAGLWSALRRSDVGGAAEVGPLGEANLKAGPSGLWKAPCFWEVSQLVKNPYQCEKLLISNSLSLSLFLSAGILYHCPLIAPFFRPTDPVYRACSWLQAANQTLHHGNGKSPNYRCISYWNLETSIYGGFPSW